MMRLPQTEREERVGNIIVNRELCNGCKVCHQACFIDVIKWDEKAKKPVIAYPDECVHCMYCEINCAKRAIKVSPDYQSYLFPRESLV
jgi:NAD-dependent dihydropyrimidine dehydrogenase PreA subunit